MIDTIIRFFYGFNPIPDSQTFTSSYPEFRFLFLLFYQIHLLQQIAGSGIFVDQE